MPSPPLTPHQAPLGDQFLIDRVVGSLAWGYDLRELRAVMLVWGNRLDAPTMDRWCAVDHPNVIACFGRTEVDAESVLVLDCPASDWGRPLALGERLATWPATPEQLFDWSFGVCQGLIALRDAGVRCVVSAETVWVVHGGFACLTVRGAGTDPPDDGVAVTDLIRQMLGDREPDEHLAAVLRTRFRTLEDLTAALSVACQASVGRAARAVPPGDPAAWRHAARASALTRLRRHEQAEAELTAARRIDPSLAQSHVNRAALYFRRGEGEVAMREVDRALSRDPDHTEALALRGVWVGLSDPEAGTAALDRVIERDPGCGRGYSARALVRRDEDGAEADLRTAHELAPDDVVVHHHEALVAGRLGDLPRAEAAYRAALAADPGRVMTRVQFAGLLDKAGRTAEAESEIARALADDPHCANVWFRSGERHEANGRTLDALREYARAAELDPFDPRKPFARGRLAERLGQSIAALAAYAETLQRDPDHTEAHRRRGELLFAAGEYADARTHFDAVLRHADDSAVAERRAECAARLAQAAPSAVKETAPATAPPDDRGVTLRAARLFFQQEYVDCQRVAQTDLTPRRSPERCQLILQSLQRLGLNDELYRELSSTFDRAVEGDPFTAALFRLTRGEVEPSDVLRLARSNTDVCRACYYAGMRAGFDADLERSHRWLLEAAAAVHEDCLEQRFAEVALGLNSAEELGLPATADLRAPFVLRGGESEIREVLRAFEEHDFASVVEAVVGMDFPSHFGAEFASGELAVGEAWSLAEMEERWGDAVKLPTALVLGRLAVISLGWLARPREQLRLAVRILARAPNLAFDRYMLHLTLKTARLEPPLAHPQDEEQAARACFYAAQALTPTDPERQPRDRRRLLEVARQDAGETPEGRLAAAELRRGPPPHTGLILPGNMPPSRRAVGSDIRLELRLAEQYCEETERACGPWSLGASIALNNFAGTLDRAGEYPRAETTYRLALDIIRECAPLSENYARCLSNLAMLYRHWGRHADTEKMYREALDVQRLCSPVSPQDLGRTLNNLGVVLTRTGNHRGAEEAFGESLALRRVFETEDLFAQTIQNLGDAVYGLARCGEAQRLVERAVAIRTRTLGREHPEIANAYTILASIHLSAGRSEEGLRCAREALAIDDVTIGPDHPQYATTLSCVATAYADNGLEDDAERYFRRAIETWRRGASGADGFGTAQLRSLALLLEAKGDREGCWAALGDLARQEATDWLPLLTAGDTRHRLEVMNEVFVSLSAQLSVIVRTFPDREPAESYARVLARKGMVGESVRLQREAVRAGGDPERTKQFRRLAELRRSLARMTLARADELTPSEWAGRFEWQREAAELERTITAGAGLTNLLAGPTPAGIAAALGDRVLVEYVRYAEVARPTGKRGRASWIAGPRYVAFVLDPGPPGSVRIVPIAVGADDIDDLVSEFRQALTGQTSPRPGNLFPWREPGRKLRAALFDPVARFLGTRTRVVLAPDGELNRLPFAALPSADGKSLIDRFEFEYVTSGRDLVRPPATPVEGARAVVLAGPAFDLATARPMQAGPTRDWNGVSFPHLTFAAVEGDAVGELLKPHFDTQVWTGRNATKQLLEGLPPPRILHLATHGFFFDAGAVDPSGNVRVRGNDPLTRGGITLAGAESWRRGERLPPEMGNGLVLAAEVAELDLTGTDLVVLSACETALGEHRSGEGVFGLQRGFTLAGARSLLMTLWPVNDQSTHLLMAAFYTELLAGVGRAAALRSAQESLRKTVNYQHVRYWAAFILVGDAGPLPLARGSPGGSLVNTGPPSELPRRGVAFFGFASAQTRPSLPEELVWREDAAISEFPPGEEPALWVVHSAALPQFRARHGGKSLPAVAWVPKNDEPPDDWWEDCAAVIRDGNAADAAELERYANCPEALAAGEAVADVPADWFLKRSGPPLADDIPYLPDGFREAHASALANPHGREQVLSRLVARSAEARMHFFPSPAAVTAWLSGEAAPEVSNLAEWSPYFQLALREQAEILLDANLANYPAVAGRFRELGLPPLRFTPAEEPGRLKQWATGLSEWVTRTVQDATDAVAEFASALLAGLMENARLVPQLAGVESVSRGGSASTPADQFTVALTQLIESSAIALSASDEATVQLTLGATELSVRVTRTGMTNPPRMVFYRDETELFAIVGQWEDGGENPDRPAVMRVAAEHLVRAASATRLTIEY